MENRAHIALTGLFLLSLLAAGTAAVYYFDSKMRTENEARRIEYYQTHECPPGHVIGVSWGMYVCVLVPKKKANND